jgi:hypothetical protein
MGKTKKNKKYFTKKLLYKYRLVVLNEDTFEERFAIKLNRLNVFVLTALSSIFLIVFTTLLIAYTPLKEFIPGYSSTALKKKATLLTYRADSLQQQLRINQSYFSSIKKVLTGDVTDILFNKDSIIQAAQNEQLIKIPVVKEDSLLRLKAAKEDKYNLFETETNANSFVLFPPVSGMISQEYNLEEKHFAVDIVVPENTPVKATADGTVIFAEWTVTTGYVLILEHSNELISVYKHNGSITKSQGDLVKSGEVIAMSGNTGALSTGPHVHFELWSKGYPINPKNFIDFQ